MSEKKIFNFYYDLCCQKLAVYPGTSSDEIKSTIREILEIPADKKVNYLDEEGNPIVISSALPNEIKIYIQIKKTFTEQIMEKKESSPNNALNSIEWFWLEEKEGSTYDKYSFERKNNNKTVTHTSNSRSSFSFGSLVMDSGEYYYTLIFEPLQCCIYASVCQSFRDSYLTGLYQEIDWFDFWRLWPDYPDPHTSYPGPIIRAGFYVNMNLKLLIVYDNSKKKEIKRVEFNKEWNSIRPIVQFKHHVSISIDSNAIKGKPEFIKL